MFKTLSLPSVRFPTWLLSAMKVLGGSLLIGIFSQAALHLPFSPVPIVLQSHICLLLGALMGSRLGTLAVLAYLIEGALGLPVFSFGRSGFGMLLGPTGGYLMGYLLGAFVSGFFMERGRAALALILGNLAIYLCGLPQLSCFVGVEKAFGMGMVPFLAGDIVKLLISYRALKFGEKRPE